TQAFCKLQGCAFQLFRCDHLIDDPKSRCFRCINRFTEKEHLARFVRRHEPRQKICSTPVRMKPDFCERLTERGISRSDAQVTRKREIEARARRWSIDRRNDRLCHLSNRENHTPPGAEYARKLFRI